MALAGDNYEREADLISFDATRTGVKGIIDSNTTAIPRIFHHDHLIDPIPTNATTTLQIPIIDLHLEDHSRLVCEVKRAATEWGFFQVVGHGVPVEVTTEMIEGVKRFNEEEDEEIRKGMYSRDNQRRVKWSSNFDLFKSKTANWRDTLFCSMLPISPSPEELPPSCSCAPSCKLLIPRGEEISATACAQSEAILMLVHLCFSIISKALEMARHSA